MTSTISTSQTLIVEKEEKKKKKTGPCHSLQLTRLYLFLGKLILYRPRMGTAAPFRCAYSSPPLNALLPPMKKRAPGPSAESSHLAVLSKVQEH